MIKKILFGALIFSAGVITAQNLTLMNSSNQSIQNKTHYFYGTAVSLSETKMHVENSSAISINFTATMTDIYNYNSADWQCCYGSACYNVNQGSSSASFPDAAAISPAGGIYSDFKVAPYIGGVASGYGVWRVKITNTTDATDSSSAYVVWMGNGTFAGDVNTNNLIDGAEIAGDIDGNGIIDGAEITGDMNGDGVISVWEIAGDANGNGIIDNGEVTSVSTFTKQDVSFTLYPNPVIDNVLLSYNVKGNTNNITITVRDILGKQLKSFIVKGSNGQIEIDATDFDSGLYFFTINIDNQVVKTEKVIFK